MTPSAAETSMKALVDSSDRLHDTEALAQRMQCHGYLYFRGFFDAVAVTRVRNSIRDLLAAQDWLDRRFPADDFICAGNAPTPGPDPRFARLHYAIQSLEHFHALPNAAEARELVRRLLGEPVFVHPRKISRVTVPRALTQTVPVHQDYTYIGGTPNFLSAWIPLKDCPVRNGALRMLDRSHLAGLVKCEKVDRHPCGVIRIADDDERWLCTDFTAGDMLLFTSTSIHGATDNEFRSIRLAMDVRYQPIGEEVAVWQTKPPFLPLTPESWDAYTEGWSKTDHVRVPSETPVLHAPEAVPLPLPPDRRGRFLDVVATTARHIAKERTDR